MVIPQLTHWKDPIQHIKISSEDVHIWVANLSQFSSDLKTFLDLLCDNELDRAYQYKFEKSRNYFIVARGILRKIISFYLPIEPCKIEFYYNIYGKPFLKSKNKSNLCFNLSHSGDLALYIFSLNCRVGIDMEK